MGCFIVVLIKIWQFFFVIFSNAPTRILSLGLNTIQPVIRMTSISVTPQDVTIEIQIIFLQISGFSKASFSFLICFVGSVSSENEDRADKDRKSVV